MSARWINRIRYWFTARRCTCRGYPHRFAGGTVQIGGMVHRIDAPCYQCDTYGQPVNQSRPTPVNPVLRDAAILDGWPDAELDKEVPDA